MGVDPDQADCLLLGAKVLGHSCNRARGDGMVPADHDRCCMTFERLAHVSRDEFIALGNRVEKAGPVVTAICDLGHRNRHIAAICHGVAERFKFRSQPRYAQGGGAHIDASAQLAEIQRCAYNLNLPARIFHRMCTPPRIRINQYLRRPTLPGKDGM